MPHHQSISSCAVTNSHYLLLKQHRYTGMKYLCYHFGTKNSCFTYRGSGVRWKQHIKENRNYVCTVILCEAKTKEGLRERGIYYSKLWNIVESDEYANLIVEDCSTGFAKINHTEYRLKLNKRTSERQKGKTMKERLNNQDYCAWNKGLKMKDYNPVYRPWNKGKTMKELRGSTYIDPRSKQFIITINGGDEIVCNSEQDFFEKMNLNGPTLSKLKRHGLHIIKRQSNSKHNYKTGDIIRCYYIDSKKNDTATKK